MREYFIEIAKNKIKNNDLSHDIFHALRVLRNCEIIAKKEGGDMDILIPGALFHDVVCYPKNHEKSKLSSIESANVTVEIIESTEFYPKSKIEKVHCIISECSFSKGMPPSSLESMILQDADRLEATGCISIMRTFASSSQMGKQFYNEYDPFCEVRKPEPVKFALDLFYTRLLKVKDLMNTATGRSMAIERTKRLDSFILGLKEELLLDE